MIDRLEARFSDETRRAALYQDGDDPFPVLEALGYALVLHSVGLLGDTAMSERAPLAGVARRAIAAARDRAAADTEGAEDAEDEREAYLGAASVAELGYLATIGKALGPLDSRPSDASTPTDRQIVNMLSGQLDGISAAYTAIRCLRDADPRPALLIGLERRARTERESAPPIALAAADVRHVRAPDEGLLLASLEDTLLEAVYFPNERQLAIYAAAPIFLGVKAPGVMLKDIKPGYWLGDITEGAPSSLELEITYERRHLRWTLPLKS